MRLATLCLAGGLMLATGGLMAAGLAQAAAAATDPLVGRWIDPRDGLRLEVGADGTFTVTPPDRPALGGTWNRDETGAVTFVNRPDAPICVGVRGRYEVIASPGRMDFVAVEDHCTPRQDHLTDGFVVDEG